MDEIVKRGYLYQQIISTSCFRSHRSWRRIFALLSDGCLFLYAAPSDLAPLARFPLYASACLFPQFPKVHRSNCLELETPCASLYLCADSPADMKSWAVAIQKAAIVASGGTLGAARSLAAASSTSMPLGGASSSTPQPGTRSLLDSASSTGGGLSTPARRNSLGGGLNLLLPDSSAAASPGRLSAAASLLEEAQCAARHERVLHRFRSGCTVTAFTSNALASLAPAYVAYRQRGKHRIAEEWQRDKARRTQRNLKRQTAPVPLRSAGAGGGTLKRGSLMPPPSFGASGSGSLVGGLIPWSELDVPSLGTLRLSSSTVLLSCPASSASASAAGGGATVARGDLSVTNTSDRPVALRVGDSASARWLATSTPRFLEAGASCVVSFEMNVPRAATPAGTPASNGKRSPAAPSASVTPALPTSLPLYCRPCDAVDLAHGSPLALFELPPSAGSGGAREPTVVHRVGERVDLKIKLHTEKHPLPMTMPMPALATSPTWPAAAATSPAPASSSASAASATATPAAKAAAAASPSPSPAAQAATPAAVASSSTPTLAPAASPAAAPAPAMNGTSAKSAASASASSAPAPAAASPLPSPSAPAAAAASSPAAVTPAPQPSPQQSATAPATPSPAAAAPANPAITPGYRRRKARAVATVDSDED